MSSETEGSLQGDLKEFCEGVRAKLTSNHGKAMLKSLVAAVDQSPEVVEMVELILAPIYLRVLLPGGPLTAAVLESFIGLALDGVIDDGALGRTITDQAIATPS